MSPKNKLELDAETMRRAGYQVIDHLIDRITRLNSEPAWRGASRAMLEDRLREPAPESGTDFDSALHRLVADVLPFAARVDHARFMAFIPGTPTWPAILADLLATGYNIFQGTWLASSGPSQVELVVLDWFKEWLGLPASAAGLFLSGGSAANLRPSQPSHGTRDRLPVGRKSFVRRARSTSARISARAGARAPRR
jgi:hypothetical protein